MLEILEPRLQIAPEEVSIMPDDLNKRGAADRKRVSKQPHEQAYQKRKAAQKDAPKTLKKK